MIIKKRFIRHQSLFVYNLIYNKNRLEEHETKLGNRNSEKAIYFTSISICLQLIFNKRRSSGNEIIHCIC